MNSRLFHIVSCFCSFFASRPSVGSTLWNNFSAPHLLHRIFQAAWHTGCQPPPQTKLKNGKLRGNGGFTSWVLQCGAFGSAYGLTMNYTHASFLCMFIIIIIIIMKNKIISLDFVFICTLLIFGYLTLAVKNAWLLRYLIALVNVMTIMIFLHVPSAQWRKDIPYSARKCIERIGLMTRDEQYTFMSLTGWSKGCRLDIWYIRHSSSRGQPTPTNSNIDI